MESYLPISFLNDFMFCPRSIYFHQLYGKINSQMYHTADQRNGLAAHKSIDDKKYTTSSKVLQNHEVYSHTLGIGGRIDTFDIVKGLLVERKKEIKKIYDGYIFQMYAQYYALVDMNYEVKKMKLYSMDDNKSYVVKLPGDSKIFLEKFKSLLKSIREFNLESKFKANPNKCKRCIYSNLCDEFSC